jgi:hypothetical protein
MTLAELYAMLGSQLKAGHGAKEVVYDVGGDGQITYVDVIDDTEFIKPDENVGHLRPQVILSSNAPT